MVRISLTASRREGRTGCLTRPPTTRSIAGGPDARCPTVPTRRAIAKRMLAALEIDSVDRPSSDDIPKELPRRAR